MRQLLAICTLTVVMLVVFAVARKNSSATVAAGGRSRQAAAPASVADGSTDDAPTSQAIVVAGGIEARTLAVKSGNPQDAVYLTSASAPNRVFLLSAPDAVASGSGLAPVAGTGQGGSLGDGGTALSAQISLSLDSLIERSEMAIAPDGTIFLADTRNGTIRRITGDASSEPGIIRSVAGRWGPRQNDSLAKPMGIALDRAGNLYIADHGTDAVDVLRAGTGRLETVAHIVSPASIAVTPSGDKVFVASPEAGSVYAISTESHAIQTFSGFAGGASACSSMPPAQTGQTQACPAGLAADSRSNLFIADVNAGQILRFDATTGIRTVAATGLDMPGDIAFDANGNLYVVEQGRRRIVEFQQLGDPSSNLTLAPPTPPAGCAQGVSFTYCNEPTGGTTQPATFTVNSSTNAVTGLTWTLNPSTPANFIFTSSSCLATLPANSSCTINIAFTPQATGLQQATLTVTDLQGDSRQQAIDGTGDDYKLQLASGQASELTVMQGGTITFQAQAVSDGVFGQNGEQVAFFCPSSSNLPAFASCVTTPCPEHIPPNSTINFQIVFVTSSPSVTAPLPEQSTPPGCTGYGVQPSSGLATPRAIELASNRPDQTFARTPLSPSLAMLAMMGTIGAMGFIRARYHWTPALGRRAIGPVLMIFTLAVGIAVTLSGCHHGSSTSPSGTPLGQTMIQIQGVAFDSQGNPLNATRDLPVITIDVVAQ